MSEEKVMPSWRSGVSMNLLALGIVLIFSMSSLAQSTDSNKPSEIEVRFLTRLKELMQQNGVPFEGYRLIDSQVFLSARSNCRSLAKGKLPEKTKEEIIGSYIKLGFTSQEGAKVFQSLFQALEETKLCDWAAKNPPEAGQITIEESRYIDKVRANFARNSLVSNPNKKESEDLTILQMGRIVCERKKLGQPVDILRKGLIGGIEKSNPSKVFLDTMNIILDTAATELCP